MFTYIKNCKYDIYTYKKKCQYVVKKYCTTYAVKTKKYANFKKLSFKYIIDDNFSLNYKLLFTN